MVAAQVDWCEMGNSKSRGISVFDFVRKQFLWDAFDNGLSHELYGNHRGFPFHLKTIQDLAAFSYLRDMRQKKIGEVGGGKSRILPILAKQNDCVNIEKFEGADGGPSGEIRIPGVRNVLAFLGERSPELADNSFDAIFSISVIEHIPNDKLSAFFDDGLRVLKPGGLWLHAIDFYIEDKPSPYNCNRFDAYRRWLHSLRLKSLGPIYEGDPTFNCDMATNPDNVMYEWGKISPKIIPLRQRAQSVSIVLAARKY